MRLFPDGASDAAWKLFEEAFKVFIIESSHAVSCSNNEQRNSLGRSFGFFPSPLFSHLSFQQPSRKTRYELRIFWLSPNFLTSDSLREECSVKQSLAPQRLRVYALITPARCYFQLLALQVLLSLLTKHCFLLRAHRSAPTCAVLLLCTAGESFEAYSKPCHGGQMGYVFS